MADRFTSTRIAEWLTPLVTTGALVVPGRLPAMPSRVISIQMQPGAGLTMDGLFDSVTFQVSCRGQEDLLIDAEDIAFQVDDIFIGRTAQPTRNFNIGVGSDSVYVSELGRTGGAPSQLPIPDDQTRWTFTCNYYAEVSTNVGQVN